MAAVLRLFGLLGVPAFLLGLLTGAGPVAIVGAFVGLFGYIGVAGGALWPDLRTFAALSPVLALGAVGPRLLAEVSRPAAFVLILALVALAALLPLRRPHLATAGLGIGLVTLISYGLPVTGDAGQLALAVVVGLAVTAGFRTLTGVRDPHGPTRAAVAGLLEPADAPAGSTTGPSPADAVALWLRDGRPLWLGHVVDVAVRLRVVLATQEATDRRGTTRDASSQDVTRLRERMQHLAEMVRARHPDGTPGRGGAPGTLDAALAFAEAQALERDATPATPPDGLRERLDRAVLARPASWRSAQIRHAVRTTLGVLLALLISLYLAPGDPLLVTLLMTVFSILQTSWSATLARARPKIAGLVLGSMVTAVLVILLPTTLLAPVAVVGLLVGLGNVTSRPLLGNTALVTVSVGFNTTLRALDPWRTLGEYAVLTVVAVVIGVVIGFGVVPGLRPRPLRARLDDAVTRTADALRAVVGHRSERPWSSPGWREAEQARAELVGDRGPLDDEQTARLDRIHVGLGDLAVLAMLTARSRSDLADLPDAARRLQQGTPNRPTADTAAAHLLPTLADEIHREWRALDGALT